MSSENHSNSFDINGLFTFPLESFRPTGLRRDLWLHFSVRDAVQ